MNGIVKFEALCDELTGQLKQISDPNQALIRVSEKLSVGQRLEVELSHSLMRVASISLRGDPVEVIVDFRDKDESSYTVTMWPVYQTDLAPVDL